MAERIKFAGIDDWNRPVFKSLDKKSHFYGCTYKLFQYWAKESEVLRTVDEDDLCYFGSRFNCEPYGTLVENLKIVRENSNE